MITEIFCLFSILGIYLIYCKYVSKAIKELISEPKSTSLKYSGEILGILISIPIILAILLTIIYVQFKNNLNNYDYLKIAEIYFLLAYMQFLINKSKKNNKIIFSCNVSQIRKLNGKMGRVRLSV